MQSNFDIRIAMDNSTVSALKSKAYRGNSGKADKSDKVQKGNLLFTCTNQCRQVTHLPRPAKVTLTTRSLNLNITQTAKLAGRIPGLCT